MKCPKCGNLDDRVVNNRHKKSHRVVRRRRECLECHHRWTTYEFDADDLSKIIHDQSDPLVSQFFEEPGDGQHASSAEASATSNAI